MYQTRTAIPISPKECIHFQQVSDTGTEINLLPQQTRIFYMLKSYIMIGISTRKRYRLGYLPGWVHLSQQDFQYCQDQKYAWALLNYIPPPPSTVEPDHFTVQRWPHLPWEPKWQVILCRSTITAQLHVTPMLWVWGHNEENSRLDSHREIRQGSPIKCWIGEVTALSGWQRGGKANYPGLPGTLGMSHIPENHSW